MIKNGVISVIALYIIIYVTTTLLTGTDAGTTFAKVIIPIVAAAGAVMAILKSGGIGSGND